MSKSDKTNVARILDSKGINYRLINFEINENLKNAEDVALFLGILPEELYKTLVLTGDKDPYLVAVVPSDARLNLKKLARASGNKSVAMLPINDMHKVTGYVRGGCSPIGMKKEYPTYIDELAVLQKNIVISAGKREHLIAVPVEELMNLTGATAVDISDFE